LSAWPLTFTLESPLKCAQNQLMACLLLQSWVFGQRERFTHGLCVCQVQNKQNLSPMDQWPKRGKSISTSYWALIFVHFDNKIKTSDARIVDSVQVKSIFGSFWAGPQHTHTIFYAALLGWALDFNPCPFFWDSPQLHWHCSVVCLGSLSSRRNFIKFILLPVRIWQREWVKWKPKRPRKSMQKCTREGSVSWDILCL